MGNCAFMVALAVTVAAAGGGGGDSRPAGPLITNQGLTPPRIVSFAPGITQVLFALGADEQVVGVTRLCRLPAGVQRPRVGDAFNINTEAILALRPDLILTQVTTEKFRGLVDIDPHVRVEYVDMVSLAEIRTAVRRIGELAGRADRAAAVLGDFDAKLRAVRRRAAGPPHPRVIFVMGTDRPTAFADGTYVGDLIELAGGINVGAEIPGTTRWRMTHIDAIAALRPDVLVCQIDQGADAGAARRYWLKWRDLPAARSGRVFVVTDPMWTIPGTHVADLAGRLAEMIHGGAAPRAGDSPRATLSLWEARLWRLLAAAIVGAALGAAGMALQGLLRNPLAEPYILGVSSGAGVGVLLGLAAAAWLAVPAWASTPVLAFAGALATCAAVYLIAQRHGRLDPYALILSGVIVNTFNGAIMLTIYLYVDPHRIADFAHWAMGRLPDSLDTHLLGVCGLLVLGGWGVLLACGPAFNVLGLGDAVAASSGVAVGRLRLATFACAAVMTAAAVALAGPVGFLGLIVPHLVRMVMGAEHRAGLAGAGLAGAALLVAAELACRAAGPLVGVSLIPVGILTALAGGPFFIVLLRRRFREVAP